MAEGDLINAREAMDLLSLSENELQNLVARGDLRAFRSAGTMKFRREDVLALKSDKGTEPTIIIPAATQRKPGQSGILQAVSAAPSAPSPAAPPTEAMAPVGPEGQAYAPAPAAADANATDEIVLGPEEVVSPADEALATQQQTVVAGAPVDAGMVEAAQTGDMTVVDSVPADEGGVQTGPAPAVMAPTASGRRGAPSVSPGSRVGPAVSRVRQQTVAAVRRQATVYQPKSAGPLWTAILVLTGVVMLFCGAVVGVAMVYQPSRMDQASDVAGGDKYKKSVRLYPPFLKTFGLREKFEHGTVCSLPGHPKEENEVVMAMEKTGTAP